MGLVPGGVHPLFRIYAPEKRPANPKGNTSGIPACHHDCHDKAFTGFPKI